MKNLNFFFKEIEKREKGVDKKGFTMNLVY